MRFQTLHQQIERRLLVLLLLCNDVFVLPWTGSSAGDVWWEEEASPAASQPPLMWDSPSMGSHASGDVRSDVDCFPLLLNKKSQFSGEYQLKSWESLRVPVPFL